MTLKTRPGDLVIPDQFESFCKQKLHLVRPYYTILSPFGPSWAILDHFRQDVNHSGQFWTILNRTDLFGPVWTGLCLLGPTWTLLSFVPKWSDSVVHLALLGIVCNRKVSQQ